jgi:SAM-dependent methyltransferase
MRRLIKKLVGKNTPPKPEYEEAEYWNSRQDPNAPEGWAPEHLKTTIDYIREHTTGARSVFEIGPGVGRTLEAHSPGCSIQCYDISSLYQERLLQRARELGLDLKLDIAEPGSGRLPYADQEFGVGVASQVFLHQRPENIARMMQEMARICRKVVVVTGGYAMPGADHVFPHDYPAICTSIGCEMHFVRALPPHIFFVYQQR